MIEKKSRSISVWEWSHARGGKEFCIQDVNDAFEINTIQSHGVMTNLINQGCMTSRRVYSRTGTGNIQVLFTPTDHPPGRKSAPPASDSMKFMVAGRALRYECLPVLRSL